MALRKKVLLVDSTVVILIVVIFVDTICYGLASYPERRSVGNFPGSGFIALYRFGRQK